MWSYNESTLSHLYPHCKMIIIDFLDYILQKSLFYAQMYSIQCVVLSILSLITIYRHQLSCNRVYVDHDTDDDYDGHLYSKLSSETGMKISSNNSIQTLNLLNHYDYRKVNNNHRNETSHCQKHANLILCTLPVDVQIQCFSYLHPRDVLNFSCTNKSSYSLIHGYKPLHRKIYKPTFTLPCHKDDNITEKTVDITTSHTIWLTLWKRDYEWVFKDTDVGQEAIQRSLQSSFIENIRCPKMVLLPLLNQLKSSNHEYTINNDITYDESNETNVTMKEFYFLFSKTWLNYIIAGHCTRSKCLTGIHGHVFEITNFLDHHPGTPETLMIQGGGRDATLFFESVGHSLSARKFASNEEMVKIIDLACCSDLIHSSKEDRRDDHIKHSLCGIVKPIKFATISGLKDGIQSQYLPYLLPKVRSRPRSPGALFSVLERLKNEEKTAKRTSKQVKKNVHAVGDVHPFFDPISLSWKYWYLDSNFKPVFIHNWK